MAPDPKRERSKNLGDSDGIKKRKAGNSDDKKRQSKVEKQKKAEKQGKAAGTTISLLADDRAVDPALSLLFNVKPQLFDPSTVKIASAPTISGDDLVLTLGETSAADQASEVSEPQEQRRPRRKRKHDGGEIEDAYMHRLAREEAKDADAAAAERAEKRRKADEGLPHAKMEEESRADNDQADDEDEVDNPALADVHIAPVDEEEEADEEDDEEAGDEDGVASPPPRHETEVAEDVERTKANRTVFLGNVTTAAITSKVARKTLLEHLKTIFQHVPEPKAGDEKHNVESIRFRSTPYASVIPKKAAFATKQVMDATSQCTNAYAVYSSPMLARAAAEHLNGSVVLGRHLRVDEIAHPAKTDHRRCVFVGNLGFVDDESNINAANEEDGREKRKPGKQPADVEEGLWRTFGRCGKVESVRVIRDSKTRVGKGVAYVQFSDENAVEAALLYEGKKFPPMLPRKLRVSRAKAQKRNAKPGSGRPVSRPSSNGYQRKVTAEEASQLGRAGKLLGRAGAAQVQRSGKGALNPQGLPNGVQRPEAFIFEGHRARMSSGKSGLKLGGRGKKGGKPANRSAKRGAAFKATTKK